MKLKTECSVLIIFLLIVFNLKLSLSQSIHKIDSLNTVLLELEDSETKADVLISISESYISNNPDKSLDYAQQALDLSSEIGYAKGQTRALYLMGAISLKKSHYGIAFTYARKTDSIAKANGFVKEKIGAQKLYGNIFFNLGDYEKAADHFFAGLKLSEEIDNLTSVSSLNNSIGNIYYVQKNYEKALDYFAKSMAISQESGDKSGIARSLNNLANTSNYLGDTVNYAKYIKRAISLNKESNNQTWLMNNYLNLSLNFSWGGQYDSAIIYSNYALEIAENLGDKRRMSTIIKTLGHLYFKSTGDTELSLTYAHDALSLAQSNHNKREIYYASILLTNLYEHNNQYDSAYIYANIKYQMKDSLNIEKKNITLAKLELQHTLDKIALEQENKEKQNTLRFLIVSITLLSGIVILLSLLIFVYIRYRLNRKQQKIIAAQNEDIASTVEELKVAQSILTNIPGVPYRCLLDKDWTMLFISDEIEQLSGYPAREFLGNNAKRSFASIMHEDDIEPIARNTSSAVEDRRPYTNEYRIIDKDGMVHWVYAKGQAIYDDLGQPLYLDGNIFDITDKKTAEIELASMKQNLEKLVAERTLELMEVNKELKAEMKERFRAEKEISISEEKFKGVFESMIDLFTRTDMDGICLMASPSIYNLTGYKPEEIIGRNLADFYADPKQRIELVETLKKSKSVENFEFDIIRKDGKTITVSTNAKIYFDGQGEPLGVEGNIRDITERKQVEEALRTSEAKFRTLVTKTEEIIYIIDKDGTFILSEGKGLSKLGLKPGEVVGKSAFEIYKDFPAMLDKMRQALSGETVIMEHEVGDNWFKSWYTPYLNQKGEIIGLLGLAVNITEQQKSKNAVVKSEKRFRATFNQAAVGIAHVAPDGRFLRVNSKFCEIVDYSQNEMLALTFQDITHPDDLEKDLENVQNLLNGIADNYSMEKRYIQKDSKIIWVNLTVSLLKDEKEAPAYFVSVVEDITEQKQVELQIQEYQHRLKDLALELTISEEKVRKQIAVDLHDNVGQLLSSSRMQLSRIIELEENPELTIRIKNISQALLKTIQATREAIFNLSPPQLNEIGLYAAIEDWMYEQVERKYNIKTSISGEQAIFRLEENTRFLVFRSIKELVINVVKHARAKRLKIEFTLKKGNLEITVQDDGIGFNYNPELLKLKSNAYGLFSIQERMSDLAGSIVIDSEFDKGTKVKLMIPLKPN